MSKTFRPWAVDDIWLLPPSVQDFVPAGHAAHLVRDLVRDELDLSAILSVYTEMRGYPPYHPGMMVALLLYPYSQGVYSSRRIAPRLRGAAGFPGRHRTEPARFPRHQQIPEASPAGASRAVRASPGAMSARWSAMLRWTAPSCGRMPPSTRDELRPHGAD